MKNWKERAEALLAQQRTAEAAQGASNEATTERLIGLGRTRISELDASLGIHQKLEDINRDVLRGLGEIHVKDPVVAPEKAYRGITLAVHSGCEIRERMEEVYEHLYGKHSVPRSSGGENGGTTTYWNVDEIGWYDRLVGQRLAGFYDSHSANLDIAIYYKVLPESDCAEVGISDPYWEDLRNLAVGILLDSGWKITENPGKYNAYRLDAETHFLGDRDLPKWSRSTYSDTGNYVGISFPYSQRDSGTLGNIIDLVLLRACANRLPYIDEWVQKRAEAEIKIRDIQSRIGQFTPVK